MDGYKFFDKPLKVTQIDESAGIMDHNQVDLDQSDTNYAFSKQSRAMLISKLSRTGTDAVEKNTNPIVNSLLGGPKPTMCIVLKNLCSAEEIARQKDKKSYISELEDEVRHECFKYGKVESLFADRETGYIWAKFFGDRDAANAHDNLRTKQFAGKQIEVKFIEEEAFQKKRIEVETRDGTRIEQNSSLLQSSSLNPILLQSTVPNMTGLATTGTSNITPGLIPGYVAPTIPGLAVPPTLPNIQGVSMIPQLGQFGINPILGMPGLNLPNQQNPPK